MAISVTKHAELDDYLRRLRSAGGPRETNAVLQRAMPVALTPVLNQSKKETPKHKGPYPPAYKYPRTPGTMRRSLKKRVGKTRIKKVPPMGFIVSEGDLLTNIYLNYKRQPRVVKSIMVGFPPAPRWRIFGKFNRGVIRESSLPDYPAVAEHAAPGIARRLQNYIGQHLKERLG